MTPDPERLGGIHRTWVFGRALATVDGESVDEELFYVSALLHDAGIESPAVGEDFTIRSAQAVAAVVDLRSTNDTPVTRSFASSGGSSRARLKG